MRISKIHGNGIKRSQGSFDMKSVSLKFDRPDDESGLYEHNSTTPLKTDLAFA